MLTSVHSFLSPALSFTGLIRFIFSPSFIPSPSWSPLMKDGLDTMLVLSFLECGFLYTRWQAECRLPRLPARESGLRREEAPLRRWPRSIQPERPETTFLFAAFSPSFLEGFIFVLSPLKLCSFDFFPPQLGFYEGFVKS